MYWCDCRMLIDLSDAFDRSQTARHLAVARHPCLVHALCDFACLVLTAALCDGHALISNRNSTLLTVVDDDDDEGGCFDEPTNVCITGIWP